jgi:hypothetical protein
MAYRIRGKIHEVQVRKQRCKKEIQVSTSKYTQGTIHGLRGCPPNGAGALVSIVITK